MAGKGPDRRYLEMVLEPLGSNSGNPYGALTTVSLWVQTK